MGWFDEQIKQRKQNDQDVFADAFINIAGAVMGSHVSAALNDERQQTKNAFDEILRFYHINAKEIPDNITDRNEQLEYLLRPHGIMRRTVTLSKGWYKDAIGAMLGIRKSDGMVVALIPMGFSGYRYRDMETGKQVKINGKNHSGFSPVSSLSRKTRENAGVIIPNRAVISIVSATNTIAVLASFSRFFANFSMLLGAPPGSKLSEGSNIRQIPVKDLSNTSIGTE